MYDDSTDESTPTTTWLCRACGVRIAVPQATALADRDCPSCGGALRRVSLKAEPRPGKPRRQVTAELRGEATQLKRQLSRATQRLLKEVRNRARGHSPGVMALVLVLTTSLACDAVLQSGFVPLLFNGVTYLDFVVHELGHLSTKLLPMWVSVAAGTGFQLALPIGAIAMFLRQGDDAAACFATAWLSTSLVNVAGYLADARAQESDMSLSANFWSLSSKSRVQPEELIHDWNYMLDGCGLLHWDTRLGFIVRLIAGAIAITAVALNMLLVWESFRASHKPRPSVE